mgnify:CR=1 FL=1
MIHFYISSSELWVCSNVILMTLPSMQSFFYICEYLGVTPQEFFDEGNPNPIALNEFIAEAKKLDSKAMSYILGIMKELNSKK